MRQSRQNRYLSVFLPHTVDIIRCFGATTACGNVGLLIAPNIVRLENSEFFFAINNAEQ